MGGSAVDPHIRQVIAAAFVTKGLVVINLCVGSFDVNFYNLHLVGFDFEGTLICGDMGDIEGGAPFHPLKEEAPSVAANLGFSRALRAIEVEGVVDF